MKRFLIETTLFVIVVFSFCCLPMLQFEKEAKQCDFRNPYSRINWVTNLKDSDAEVLILGNSRALDCYNDSILSVVLRKKCLNCGFAGYPFDYQYHIMYQTYIKNNRKPNYIIVEVNPWAYFDYFNENYIVEMLPYVNRKEFDFYIKICPELSESDKLLFVRYAGQLRNVIHELYLFHHPEKDYWNSVIIKKWRSDMFTEERELEHDESIVQLFNSFLKECAEQGIKVVLVCSPIHQQDGARYFDMEGFRNLIYDCASETNTCFLDYDALFGNDTTLFIDPMHLNDLGRTNFSLKLAHDLDSLDILLN